MTFDQLGKPAQLSGLTDVVSRMLAAHVGAENALARSRILSLVHELPLYRRATDRHIRTVIEELRERGVLLCNMATGDGYYLAGSPDEYQAFKALYLSHATTMLARARSMDRTAEAMWGAAALQERLL